MAYEQGELLAPLRREFIAVLTRGDFAAAKSLLAGPACDSDDLRNIYLEVLEPAEREVRRLFWKEGLPASKAHLMTMLIQELIEGFSGLVFHQTSAEPRPPWTAHILVTTPPGELHEVGPRIIADLLELEGFDTTLVSSPDDANAIMTGTPDGRFSGALLVVTTPGLLTAEANIASRFRDVCDSDWLGIGGDALRLRPQEASLIEADFVFTDAAGALATVKSRVSADESAA